MWLPCMFISAATWRMRWLMPPVAIGTSMMSGIALGAYIAARIAYTTAPDGVWYTADGYTALLNSYSYDWHNLWPSWLLAVVLAVVALVLGSRAFRNRKCGAIRALGGFMGSIGLFGILISRNFGVPTFALVIIAILIALFWIPGEFGTIAKMQIDGTHKSYEWDASLYLWVDFVLICAACFAIID